MPPLKRYENEDAMPAGSTRARVLATTPAKINTMRLDLNIIGLATQNLWITDAYFMPTRTYVQALINAAKAGVDVTHSGAAHFRHQMDRHASRTQYRSLLDAGVRVFEWTAP